MRTVFNTYLSGQTPSPEESPVTCSAWNRLNGLIACGHKNGFVSIIAVEKDDDRLGMSRIRIKMTLPQHQCEITSLVWNEKYGKLITADVSGLLLIWYEREEKWIQYKPSERTGFKITATASSHNGEFVLLGSENGILVCGTGDAEARWSVELNSPITSIELVSETQKVYVGTKNSILYSITEQGKVIKAIDLSEASNLNISNKLLKSMDSSSDENDESRQKEILESSVDAIDTPSSPIIYVGSNHKQPEVILVAYQDGEIVLLNSETDELIISFNTEMFITSAAWSRDGVLFAITGRPKEAMEYRVNFYSEDGVLLRSQHIASLNIGSIYFDESGNRLCLGIGNSIGIIQIVRVYPYHFFKNTLVYSAPNQQQSDLYNMFHNIYYFSYTNRNTNLANTSFSKIGNEILNKSYHIVFYNPTKGDKHVKEVHNLLGICGTPNIVVIASHLHEEENDITAIVVCNEFGIPIMNARCNFPAYLFSASDTIIVAASKNNMFLWNYKTDVTKGLIFKRSITAISIKSKFLFVAFESKELISYAIHSLDEIEEYSRYTIPFVVEFLDLSSDETRISMIDVYGNMVFLDIHSGTATKGTRNDTWCAKWAEDSPNYFVSLEKQRLYVYHDFIPEESIMSLTHIGEFKDLVVQTMNFLDLLKDPLNPSPAYFHRFDSKPLHDLKLLLTTTIARDEIITYVKEKNHPTLWKLLAEACLESKDIYNAQKAFEQTHDKASQMFMKAISSYPRNSDLQNGLISWFLQKYDLAEEFLTRADRIDLVLEMLSSMCNWHRIIEIADYEENKDLIIKAHEMLGYEEIENDNWEEAAEHFRNAGDIENYIECLFNGRMHDKINLYINSFTPKSNKNNEIMKKIGHKFALLGNIEQSIRAFLKIDDVNEAIEACISLDEWKQALLLADQYKSVDKKKIVSRYAQHLTEKSHSARALSILIKYNLNEEASKIFENEGYSFLKRQNYISAKKSFVFAAMQSMKGSNQDQTKKMWHIAEGIHFLLLSNRAIFQKKWSESIELASRLFSEYSDVVGREQASAILALIGVNSGYYKQCSKGFVHLENSPKLRIKKREQFEKLAIKIFSKVEPNDPSECEVFNCKSCKKKMIYPQVKCRCGYSTIPSILTGNKLNPSTSWRCKNCLHYANYNEISGYKVCPLCHQPIA